MAPGHLPGHSRKEGEGTQTEDDACGSFLPEDIAPSHSYFYWTHLHPQSAGAGGHPLCASVYAEDTVLPPGSQPSPSR